MTDTYARRTVLASIGAFGAVGLGTAGQSLAVDESTDQQSRDESSPPAAWPQMRGVPARTGAVPAEAAPGGEYAAKLWVSGSAELVFVDEPIVADGAVYRPFIVDDRSYRGGVAAFDAETGEQRWRHVAPRGESGIGRVNTAPAVTDGRLYLTSFPGTSLAPYGGLHALDTQTGEIVWSKTEKSWGGPLVDDGTLYVTQGSAIVALDPATGNVRWQTEETSYYSGYTGLTDGTLYGMRTDTDSEDQLAAWDASDGSLLWTSTVENTSFTGGAVGNDAIYYSVDGVSAENPNVSTKRPNGVVSYTASDGSVRWRTTLTPEGKQPREHISGPAVADGTVYVSTGVRALANVDERGVHATVYALDAASGEVRWARDTSTVLVGDPSVAGETVFVGGHAAPQEDAREGNRFPTVHALSTADGSERWSYLVTEDVDEDMATNTAATPTLAGGRVYAGIQGPGGRTGQRNGVFALAASDVAPEATNRPISSDSVLMPVGDFESVPTDPDGDGKFEDVNGDGKFDIVDVQALFANRDDPAIQNNPQKFDFNDDGEFDVVDVQALFTELTEEK